MIDPANEGNIKEWFSQ